MIWGGGAPMRENNVKFKTGNNKREGKESSLPSGYSLKLRWEEVDRRSSKKRDLYQDLAMLRPRRFVYTKMKQESNKSFAYKCVMTLAPPKFVVKDYSDSLILLRKGFARLTVNQLLLLLIISSEGKTFQFITSKSLTNLLIHLQFFKKELKLWELK